MANRPRGLSTPGRRLWDAVTGEYELDAPELALLEEACKIRDFLADLRAKVAESGAVIDSAQGPRVHPAAVQGRQQTLALAKVVGALGLPKGALDDIDGS
ncbi:hypothetical protein MB901379_00484 [Mycobacterium basiliense]|uniref:Phage terminase, small subunit, P27 family n=1 Tax=Mycobacterium basiliense TaxID=2094119 RepID=A0A3S4BCL0_9MYCO|nr:hypothetical protein [Mycobacterium basiliense]VDM86955.1 hypothetical protein MB901379_00484 [Mycobacterium basiliense]